MELGLKDRVAIVAAASKGLGKAVALGLAREGANVTICSRNADSLLAAVEDIRAQTGVDVVAQCTDVTVEDQVRDLVAETLKRFGRVDICVTNSGGPPAKPFSETSLADWKLAVHLNLLSTFYFAHEVLPLMQKQRWGRLIAITSVAVKQPIDGLILSNSIRAAVTGMVKSLSNEYARYNVLVNNVCPGYTETERLVDLARTLGRVEGVSTDKIRDRWAAQVPLGRLGTPEEFAALVVFLASERASYITGASVAVDGGLAKGLFS